MSSQKLYSCHQMKIWKSSVQVVGLYAEVFKWCWHLCHKTIGCSGKTYTSNKHNAFWTMFGNHKMWLKMTVKCSSMVVLIIWFYWHFWFSFPNPDHPLSFLTVKICEALLYLHCRNNSAVAKLTTVDIPMCKESEIIHCCFSLNIHHIQNVNKICKS